MRVTLYSKVSTFAFRSRGKNTIKLLDRLLAFVQQSDRKAPIRQANLPIEEEDESMEEEEEEEEKKEQIMPATTTPTPGDTITPTPVVVSAEPDMATQLGPFVNSPEECSKPFNKIFTITNWSALHHRYKPENIPYLNKVLAARVQFEERLDHTDWKVSVEDKKEGLTIWVRTTSDGLNAVKAQGIINHPPEHIFMTIGNVDNKKLFDDTFDEA